MLMRVELSPRHSQTQLKRHIKSRCARRSSIQLDPREIVNRIPATLYQCQYPIQSALASRNSEGSAWFKSKLSQSNDVGKIKAAEALIVGNIYEYSIWLNWRRHACSSYLA
jgi:hypothetical protein